MAVHCIIICIYYMCIPIMFFLALSKYWLQLHSRLFRRLHSITKSNIQNIFQKISRKRITYYNFTFNIVIIRYNNAVEYWMLSQMTNNKSHFSSQDWIHDLWKKSIQKKIVTLIESIFFRIWLYNKVVFGMWF